MRYILWSIIGLMSSFALSGQEKQIWVDSVYQSMSEDERLGQLFTLRAFSHNDQAHIDGLKKMIEKIKPGGLCFFQGSPENQVKLTNTYQGMSDIPMLISIDGEWGVGMRFKDQVVSYPRQLMLGAIQDDNLIYEMGGEVADQCKRMGIHVNFAPVVDVNNNPDNPVINDRSFGEDIYNVSAKGFAYMKGMQDNGVMASAKHFPGHGDTGTDSHHALPIITHDRERLDSLELMPFQVLIDQGVGSVMVAHIHFPTIDDRENRPTTLSEKTITGILRNDMGFDGVVFTDAMEMQGVLNHFPSGIAEAEALAAGNDMILLPMDPVKSMNTIKEYVQTGKLTWEQLEKSVKRILKAKYDMGFSNGFSPLNPQGVSAHINRGEAQALKSKLIRNAITLVTDSTRQIPVSVVNKEQIASLSIGTGKETAFQTRMGDLTGGIKRYSVASEISESKKSLLLSQLKGYDKVIVSFHDMSKYASKNWGLSESSLSFINSLSKQNKVITILFGSPYALERFDNQDPIIVSYNDDKLTQEITAEALLGASVFRGKLPVGAGERFTYGMGQMREAIGSMGYEIPENVGMSSDTLALLDTLIAEMIEEESAPGCQILIAKDGKIVYEKAYGHFTYKKNRKVNLTDMYDLASVTKIMASTLSMMKLQDEGKLDITDPVSKYVTQLDTTNKADMRFEDMMAHHARLIGWIPFYIQTVTEDKRNPKPLPDYYDKRGSSDYAIPVAKNLYMRSDFRDSLWSQIYGCKLRENPGYRYSDLGFYLVHNTIKNITGQGVDEYAHNSFYEPMGLEKTTFNPYLKHSVLNIAPSEEDIYFRRQKIQGYVHDMGAAMLGGVSGHAGLFSNAREIALLMQMLLNGGEYGGERYLSQEVIRQFTSRYPGSTRRGIGFDMKELNEGKSQNMSEYASANTFGHLGFTGTAAFADPDHNLVFIFLSNRTYPSMNNRKFIRNSYRTKAHSIAYKALLKNRVN